MIRNPKLGQKVFFFENSKITEGTINTKFIGAVEIGYYHHRFNREIYKTKESAEKDLLKSYEEEIKSLNQQIFQLSKNREKLATKLAELLENR